MLETHLRVTKTLVWKEFIVSGLSHHKEAKFSENPKNAARVFRKKNVGLIISGSIIAGNSLKMKIVGPRNASDSKLL